MARRTMILSALPLLILAAYIALLGLDIPFWDQWTVVPLLAKMKQGSLSFADLFSHHSEHRPFFPRLLWLALARWTAYNTNAELWLNLAIALITFGVFVAYTNWVWRQQGVRALDSLLPLLALLVFNLAQWESWLMGFQTTMFLGMMAVVTGFIILSRFNNWYGLLGGALLGIIATFSTGNGVLYWPIGLLMIVLFSEPKYRWLRLMSWIVISALVLVAFFHGWEPSATASVSILWQRPFRYTFWVLNFIGAPLLTYWYAWIFGILSFVWIGVVGLRASRVCRSQLLAPYGAIIILLLASALAIGIGRSSISFTSSAASRYLTMTVWYWASLLALLPLSRLADKWQRLVKLAVVFMLCVCMVGGGLLGYYWRYSRTLPVYQAIRNGQDVTDSDLLSVGTLPATGRENLKTLCEYNWSVCRK